MSQQEKNNPVRALCNQTIEPYLGVIERLKRKITNLTKERDEAQATVRELEAIVDSINKEGL